MATSVNALVSASEMSIADRFAQLRVRSGLRTRLRRSVQRLVWNVRAGDDRDEFVRRHLTTLFHWHRVVCGSLPDARLLELDGVVASAIPAVADSAGLNVVLYEDAGALARGLDDLALGYREAGVHSWMAWVPSSDRPAARALKRAGYRLIATPIGMGCRLADVDRPPQDALEDWTRDGDPAVMAQIADEAFGTGTAFQRAYSRLPAGDVNVYMAESAGSPASCVVTTEFEGNCSVTMVATRPEAQRRGLSGALLRHALVDARERGCAISTLSSSDAGRGIYERLGYFGLGPFEHWEMPWRQ